MAEAAVFAVSGGLLAGGPYPARERTGPMGDVAVRSGVRSAGLREGSSRPGSGARGQSRKAQKPPQAPGRRLSGLRDPRRGAVLNCRITWTTVPEGESADGSRAGT